MDRNKKIIRTSIWGIAVNMVLVAFKATVGLIVNSIAIILDAVNNLSDAMSSIITIIGTKLSGKKPDKKHPYGYGRIEYFSSIIIAVLVLLAGITALRESADKIINPETANYNTASLIIVSVAVIVKFVFGRYVKKVGESVNSRKFGCIRYRCIYGCNFIFININSCNYKHCMEYKFGRISRCSNSNYNYKI